MTIAHKNIVDPFLHEPKGVGTAANNTVYVANGAGSGSWSSISTSVLDMSAIKTSVETDLDDGTITVPVRAFIPAIIDDISTADSALIPLIQDCTVIGATLVLEGAITAADASITFKNSSGTSMGSAVTVPFTSSAKGDQFNFTASAANTITGPDWIEVATDGGSTDTQKLFILIEIQYEANLNVT